MVCTTPPKPSPPQCVHAGTGALVLSWSSRGNTAEVRSAQETKALQHEAENARRGCAKIRQAVMSAQGHGDSRATQMRALDAFRRFDPDGLGYVQPASFRKALHTLCGCRMSDDEYFAAMRALDTDGDGTLQYRELQGALREVLVSERDPAEDLTFQCEIFSSRTGKVVVPATAETLENRRASLEACFEDSYGEGEDDEPKTAHACDARFLELRFFKDTEQERATAEAAHDGSASVVHFGVGAGHGQDEDQDEAEEEEAEEGEEKALPPGVCPPLDPTDKLWVRVRGKPRNPPGSVCARGAGGGSEFGGDIWAGEWSEWSDLPFGFANLRPVLEPVAAQWEWEAPPPAQREDEEVGDSPEAEAAAAAAAVVAAEADQNAIVLTLYQGVEAGESLKMQHEVARKRRSTPAAGMVDAAMQKIAAVITAMEQEAKVAAEAARDVKKEAREARTAARRADGARTRAREAKLLADAGERADEATRVARVILPRVQEALVMGSEEFGGGPEAQHACLLDTFEKYDDEESGMVSMADLREALDLLGVEVSEEEFDCCIPVFDESGDGFLTREWVRDKL